jgi:signal transduction histidine kinase
VRASLNEYTGVQEIESAAAKLISFKQKLRDPNFDRTEAARDLRMAQKNLGRYRAMVSQYNSILPPQITPGQQSEARIRTKAAIANLSKLVAEVEPPRASGAVAGTVTPTDVAEISDSADRAIAELTGLLSVCNDFLNRTQLASDHDIHVAVLGVSTIAACMLIFAVLASLWNYRRILVPLQSLRRWCGRIAEGDFSERYVPGTEHEFQQLGRDVNKMAAELGAFYRELEAMVASKSRELVRSERLASVGYLAAGVAHEINSPLNIMSGYAELSIKQLRRLGESPVHSTVLDHLAIIRGEAFRCKQITQKLLSLTRKDGGERQVICLNDALTDVVAMVNGLSDFRGKQINIHLNPTEPLCVYTNLTEIKQVLLNLVVNALEAVRPPNGCVTISGRRADESIELEVADNGRGMSSQTRERVFEPFFTNKRGAGEPGTGLGLSITHAIVTSHGGQISAFSEGVGRGSRFTIRMPARDRVVPTPAGPQSIFPSEVLS